MIPDSPKPSNYPPQTPVRYPVAGQSGEDGSLPCLNINISTETIKQGENLTPSVSPSASKTAFVLRESVRKMVEQVGVERVGFLTLTFPDYLTCPKEAQRRFNSIATHVLRPRYRDYIAVFERCKSGAIHYHILVTLPHDIKTGFDHKAVVKRDYTSASAYLRAEWIFWREISKNKKYGFGRHELMPIKTNATGISNYVAKYISKHLEARLPEDKGVKLVRMTQGVRAGNTRFQWNSKGAAEWRKKVSIYVTGCLYERTGRVIIGDGYEHILGMEWVHRARDRIMTIDPTDRQKHIDNLKDLSWSWPVPAKPPRIPKPRLPRVPPKRFESTPETATKGYFYNVHTGELLGANCFGARWMDVRKSNKHERSRSTDNGR